MNPIYKFEIGRAGSNNLLNPNTVARGYSIMNDGEIIESPQFDTTDYIPVEVGSSYHVLKNNSELYNPYWVIWFDENKNFVDNSYSRTGVFIVPAGCAYARFDFPNETQAYGGFRPEDLGFFAEEITTFEPFFSTRVYPLYKDDLTKDFEKESGQEFFRAKLSGKLTFEGPDYDWIVAQAFDFQFDIIIFISYNGGSTWETYWEGTFWKTDCDFDRDTKTVVVTPTVKDQYTDVLAGMEKEYNLIDLLPEIVEVNLDKRPMIQIYVPGQSVIGCFLSGMWWEQECEPESDETKLQETGDGKLNFAKNSSMFIADVSGTFTPEIPDVFTAISSGFNPNALGIQDFPSEDYTLRYSLQVSLTEENAYDLEWIIFRNSDSMYLFYYTATVYSGAIPNLPQSIQLSAVNGATGTVNLYLHEMPVYARYLLDVDSIVGNLTYTLPDDDIVPDNRNYHRVVRYPVSDIVCFSDRLSEEPTKWGIYQPGLYYEQPDLPNPTELYPVSRNAWGRISIWFKASVFDSLIERQGRARFTLKDTYPLWSVISVLLSKFAPGITHENSVNYSAFLYGTNPLTNIDQSLVITPKSNVISAGYDQPAQKAPITLKNVLDMLRDCFRCYWFIDEQNRFRIEHIQYFRNGGSYSGSPVVGIDLTTQKVTRNGKPWAFGRNQFKFDKPEMASRYEFGWMDDVTQLFEGYPIDILSKYVAPNNIEQINVSGFTSDIDYILLNPGDISKDGFVLMAALYSQGHEEQVINLREQTMQDYIIDSNTLHWGTDDTVKHIIVAFTAGQKVQLTSGYNGAKIAWLRNNNMATPGGVVPYVADTSLIEQGSQTTVEYTVPGTGTVYLYMMCGNPNNPVYRPQSLIIPGVPDGYNLPYVDFIFNGTDHILQNGYVAFKYLQQYYAYDMPAPDYVIDGVEKTAIGTKKLKTQSLKFPLLYDPDLVKLIRTGLGYGQIQKLSINLSSRNANATLKYDTE